MDAINYKISAVLALTMHVLAAVCISGLMVRSLSAVSPPPAIVRLNLAVSPAASAMDAPVPRCLTLPRPQPRSAERVAATVRTPVESVPTAVADASVTHMRTTMDVRHADIGNAKAVFLASLAETSDGSVAANMSTAGQRTGDYTGMSGADIDDMPVPRTAIRPLYPVGARRRSEAGQVVLEAMVAANGRTAQVAVITSSSFSELDLAAERAIRQTAFKPASRNGRPVAALVRITIIFRLTD